MPMGMDKTLVGTGTGTMLVVLGEMSIGIVEMLVGVMLLDMITLDV